MPKLSPIRGKELIKILEKLGFENVYQKGSHVRMRHQDGRRLQFLFMQVKKLELAS